MARCSTRRQTAAACSPLLVALDPVSAACKVYRNPCKRLDASSGLSRQGCSSSARPCTVVAARGSVQSVAAGSQWQSDLVPKQQTKVCASMPRPPGLYCCLQLLWTAALGLPCATCGLGQQSCCLPSIQRCCNPYSKPAWHVTGDCLHATQLAS